MISRWYLLAASAAIALSLQASSAATLHEPLPPDSLERNGTPQTKTANQLRMQHDNPAVPDMPNHPNAAQGLKRPFSGTPVDVLNYHNDSYPTGWNPGETDLTPATVGSANFGKLTTLNVDGNVLAQPLMVSNFTMPDNTVHNVLIVATGHNSVYAYDAQTYDVLWHVNLGTSQSTNDVGCGDVQPEYGISSTPVIVRTAPNAATIYLVAATEPASFSFHTKLHALDLGTGADLKRATEIAPQAHLKTGGHIHFDPQNQWSRAALAYANGSIYMGIGSHCDNSAGSISGWMLRYDTDLKLQDKFNTIEASAGYELSSIWMSGFAPAIDSSGNVFAITGNGNFGTTKTTKGYGESVLSLSSSLKINSTFTPSNYQQLNEGDTDFGSGGFMLIPPVPRQKAPPLGVGMGKASELYLLDASNLGGLEGSGGTGPIQKFSVSGGGIWGGPAYYVGPSGGIVFYQVDGGVLNAYAVATGNHPSLSVVASGTSGGSWGGSFPVVSSNGGTAGTGVVWLIRRGSTEVLEAYNAESLGAPLFSSNTGTWSNGGRAYLSPLVANGRVYAGAYKTVTVFGLTQ